MSRLQRVLTSFFGLPALAIDGFSWTGNSEKFGTITQHHESLEPLSGVQGAAVTTGSSLISPQSRVLQAENVIVTHGTFNQVAGDSTVHNHNYFPAPRVDIMFLLRLVRNLRKTQQDNLAKAAPGTGVWILKTKSIKLWLDSNGNVKLLWGTGIPGAGKTVLVALVISEIERRAAANPSICVAYIYFRYTDAVGITVRDVLEILVKQTVERHQDCKAIAEEIYLRHEAEGTQPTEGELLRLLGHFIEAKSMTFYFLDALDEAPSKIQVDIVKKLESLNARLFITSRPLKMVEAQVHDVHSFTIAAQNEDIDCLIQQEISRSRDFQGLLARAGPSFREWVVSSIKNNCGGMFLHASLQLNELCECASPHEVAEVLETFPHDIEDACRRSWIRVQRQKHASIAQAVFLWVLSAMRPMTISEVERAVATCPMSFKFDTGRMVPRETLLTI